MFLVRTRQSTRQQVRDTRRLRSQGGETSRLSQDDIYIYIYIYIYIHMYRASGSDKLIKEHHLGDVVKT